MSSYINPMLQIRTYGYCLGRDPNRCGIDVLNETLRSGFSSELQKMQAYAKEVLVLVSGDKNQVKVSDAQLLDDLESVLCGLSRIARKIDERSIVLNVALTNVPLCQATFTKLSEPVIDRTKNAIGWRNQALERWELVQKCRRVFSQFPDMIKDHRSATEWMQGEFEKVDLERCKKISEEYASSSKDITSLSQQIGAVVDNIHSRVYPKLKSLT